MIAPPGPDCWLHPDVEVRPSLISGRGLFAMAPITAGTVVSRLGGRLVSGAVLRELFAAAARNHNFREFDDVVGFATQSRIGAIFLVINEHSPARRNGN